MVTCCIVLALALILTVLPIEAQLTALSTSVPNPARRAGTLSSHRVTVSPILTLTVLTATVAKGVEGAGQVAVAPREARLAKTGAQPGVAHLCVVRVTLAYERALRTIELLPQTYSVLTGAPHPAILAPALSIHVGALSIIGAGAGAGTGGTIGTKRAHFFTLKKGVVILTIHNDFLYSDSPSSLGILDYKCTPLSDGCT